MVSGGIRGEWWYSEMISMVSGGIHGKWYPW